MPPFDTNSDSDNDEDLRPWDVFPIPGPADLYRAFAVEAVSEFIASQGWMPEEQIALIHEAADVAITVVLTAASIQQSWTPDYERSIAQILQ